MRVVEGLAAARIDDEEEEEEGENMIVHWIEGRALHVSLRRIPAEEEEIGTPPSSQISITSGGCCNDCFFSSSPSLLHR